MRRLPRRPGAWSLVPAGLLGAGLGGPAPAGEPGVVGTNLKERALLTLADQGVSLVAVAVANEGCGAVAREYHFEGEVEHDGSGAATIDDHRFTLAVVAVTERDVTLATGSAGEGEVADTRIRGLDGVFVHLATSDREFADAVLEAAPPAGEPGRYRAALVAELEPAGDDGVRGRAAEVVSGAEPPPVRWTQRTDYRRPLSELGSLEVTRSRAASEDAPACEIRLSDAVVDNYAAGMQVEGRVTVRVIP